VSMDSEHSDGTDGRTVLMVGFDEAGRGPLAGPVVAAAVILPPDFPVEILDDSKRLSPRKREAAQSVIRSRACWGIGSADHRTIDRVNILEATMLAMRDAFDDMSGKFGEWASENGLAGAVMRGMTDGTRCPDVSVECHAEPRADGKYPAVMAASILAKTYRDTLMAEYDRLYPEYGYAGHKGYPTRGHIAVCRRLGPSPIQRLTFRY